MALQVQQVHQDNKVSQVRRVHQDSRGRLASKELLANVDGLVIRALEALELQVHLAHQVNKGLWGPQEQQDNREQTV